MVFDVLRDIIAQTLEIDVRTITLESDLREDFDADSLDFVDIVMSIEDEFTVEIPEDAMESLITVGDLVKFIEDNK